MKPRRVLEAGAERPDLWCPSRPHAVTVNGYQVLLTSVTCLPSYPTGRRHLPYSSPPGILASSEILFQPAPGPRQVWLGEQFQRFELYTCHFSPLGFRSCLIELIRLSLRFLWPVFIFSTKISKYQKSSLQDF